MLATGIFSSGVMTTRPRFVNCPSRPPSCPCWSCSRGAAQLCGRTKSSHSALQARCLSLALTAPLSTFRRLARIARSRTVSLNKSFFQFPSTLTPTSLSATRSSGRATWSTTGSPSSPRSCLISRKVLVRPSSRSLASRSTTQVPCPFLFLRFSRNAGSSASSWRPRSRSWRSSSSTTLLSGAEISLGDNTAAQFALAKSVLHRRRRQHAGVDYLGYVWSLRAWTVV